VQNTTNLGLNKPEDTDVIDEQLFLAQNFDKIDEKFGILLGSQIKGTDNKKYKIVACVLRNDGSGWYALNDTGHVPVNVTSVTNTSSVITINYGFTGTKVVSLVCVPDETLAAYGFTFGASVNLDNANITVARTTQMVSAYVSYNGTGWDVTTSGASGNVTFTSFSSTTGIIILTHDPIDYAYAGATIRSGTGGIDVVLESVNTTTTQIKFRDSAGNAILTPNTNMKAYVNRFSPTHSIDPNTLTTAQYPFSNIWVYGIMEVS
jgi:hypothetical protein